MGMPKKIQCKHIPELPILEFLHDRMLRGEGWAYWYQGFDNSIPVPEGIPDKLIVAKMAQMIAKGLVDGCPCGCRGDYAITDNGIKEMWRQLKCSHS